VRWPDRAIGTAEKYRNEPARRDRIMTGEARGQRWRLHRTSLLVTDTEVVAASAVTAAVDSNADSPCRPSPDVSRCATSESELRGSPRRCMPTLLISGFGVRVPDGAPPNPGQTPRLTWVFACLEIIFGRSRHSKILDRVPEGCPRVRGTRQHHEASRGMQRHVQLTPWWRWRRGGHVAGWLAPRLAPRPRLSPMQSGDPRQLDEVETADGPPRSCVDGSRPVPALPFVRPTANPPVYGGGAGQPRTRRRWRDC
jgi:hypothetical protein